MRVIATNNTYIDCGDCANKIHMGGCKVFYNKELAWLSGKCSAQRLHTSRWRNKLDEYNTNRINHKT